MGKAFESLANYISPEDLFDWQGYFLDEHDIIDDEELINININNS